MRGLSLLDCRVGKKEFTEEKMMNRTIPKIGAAVVNGTGGNFYGADKQKRLGTDS